MELPEYFTKPQPYNKSQQTMKLKKEILNAINTPQTRHLLMDTLGVTEFTIARYIQKNSDNLTKAAAMQVIRQITGLADAEILE